MFMENYIPPYEISNKMIDYVAKIMEKIGKIVNIIKKHQLK